MVMFAEFGSCWSYFSFRCTVTHLYPVQMYLLFGVDLICGIADLCIVFSLPRVLDENETLSGATKDYLMIDQEKSHQGRYSMFNDEIMKE